MWKLAFPNKAVQYNNHFATSAARKNTQSYNILIKLFSLIEIVKGKQLLNILHSTKCTTLNKSFFLQNQLAVDANEG